MTVSSLQGSYSAVSQCCFFCWLLFGFYLVLLQSNRIMIFFMLSDKIYFNCWRFYSIDYSLDELLMIRS